MNKIPRLPENIRISGIRFKNDGSQKYETNVIEITEIFHESIKRINQLITLLEKLDRKVKNLENQDIQQKNHFHNIYESLKKTVTTDQFNKFLRIFKTKKNI